MATLSPAARKRVMSDLKHLQEEPIPLAAAAPCSDDLSLWNGIIGTQMEVTHLGFVTVPLHFLIEFPCDYPASAPRIGFSFEFEYRGGAEYIQQEGRLKGKKVICLDVLGNFDFVHTEWKQTVGSGWSPAYTVTTLLVQLQSVLSDLGMKMSQKERDVTYQSAVRFCEKNPDAILEILDEDEVRELQRSRRSQQRVVKLCRNDTALAAKVNDFAQRLGFSDKETDMEDFLELLSEVSKGSSSASETSEVAVDSNICCWSTGKLYTEAMLGVGIRREKKNLGTAAELLSKEAFDGGLRQNTDLKFVTSPQPKQVQLQKDKSTFEFFLPVWINYAHAAGQQTWQSVLMKQVKIIAKMAFDVADEEEAILEVFPRLINQMIVEMMKPDASKSAAIATFEALCNFWRTFRWLVDTRVKLRKMVATRLMGFVKEENNRHKDQCPDLGALLVLFTVLQGDASCPKREDFLNHYVDENSLRWVMWWQRSGTKPEGVPVFQATQVSREILMFQMTVIEVVIGDVPKTLQEMELSNCKMPERLERLQQEWRQRKASVNNWGAYFKCLGVAQPQFGSTAEWITSCVRRAEAKGPKYGGAGQDGKGKGGKGGKGKGKW
eukprot:symbB.v1.2.029722.t2/scaffold3287.1/size59763/9